MPTINRDKPTSWEMNALLSNWDKLNDQLYCKNPDCQWTGTMFDTFLAGQLNYCPGCSGGVYRVAEAPQEFILEFFAYETIGMTPAQVESLVRYTHEGTTITMSKPNFDKLCALKDEEQRRKFLLSLAATGQG